ncbi:MAG: AEC family transporter [Clostridia bacterium]|nr:AEC family transporter [Clostridia bacterium]
MRVFFTTLNQTAFLFLFILAGYVLVKGKQIPESAGGILSKLESLFLIPALVLGTFIENFTREKIARFGVLLLGSLGILLLFIGLASLCARFCTKDSYLRKLYAYGLAFSNFGFMGNAVVNALFPEIFLEYLIFTLPLWSMIYLFGAPVWLMGGEGKESLGARLKNFINPMFVCTLLGMLIGFFAIPVPSFCRLAISAAGNCMSPVAMLLTGMTVARFPLKEMLKDKGIYPATLLRLLVFPLLFIAAAKLFHIMGTFAVCALCSLAMPMGLNAIIIPESMGKDTRAAAGMALVSHVAACVTIPLVLLIYQTVFPS